ncbi:MAG TPA: helix-turn-helix domain-containing protein [Promicromonospora sp.]|nr:helix-turn-helix domain-containing protein [Promicromonospora sp.]
MSQRQDYLYFKQWRLDREAGKGPRMVPSGPTREHIAALVQAGASQASVARAAGVSPEMVSNLLRRPRPTVQIGSQTRILAVTIDDVMRHPERRGFVPAVGARRRIQALLAMGWPHRIITERMTGVGQTSRVALHQRGKWIARATHDAVVAAYDELSMKPGPSEVSRQSAARLGYMPPLAWDDETIDDPAAKPHTSAAERRPGIDLDEWARLVRCGEAPERAAERCGTTVEAVSRAAHRAGRRDIGRLAERASWRKRGAA